MNEKRCGKTIRIQQEYEKVKEDFDGHTPSDVIERLQQVINL